MRTAMSIFVVATVMFCLTGAALAQRTVTVDPGFGTLNDAIDADTTAAGARVDTNTVYVLESGGTYLLNGSIENRYPLTIVAADGSTARPKLIPGVPTGGGSSRPFRARSDLTLKGLYVTNKDELGSVLLRAIRVSADSVRIELDDCHVEWSSQSGFRLDNIDNNVILTNSIFSNIGNPVSPNNGRGVDDRGHDIDSLVVTNCTFYNVTNRVLNDLNGGKLNYFDFNHNTVVNVGMGPLELGEVVEAHVTNNLFVNGMYFNVGSMGGNEIVEGYYIQASELGADLVAAGATQMINVRNNNFYTDPAVVAAWPALVGSDTRPLFNDLVTAANTALNTTSTNIVEAVTFTAGAPNPIASITDFYALQPSDARNDSLKSTVDGDVTGFDTTGEPYDFAYTGGTSYSHSTGGQPLGSLVWHDLTIVASDREADLGDGEDPGDGGTPLPSGTVGPLALDLDLEFGDQEDRQLMPPPSAGSDVEIDIVITEGGTGAPGFEVDLEFDPTQLEFTSFEAKDVFSGAMAIATPSEGAVNVGVVFLGGSGQKESGSAGVAVFSVLTGFSGEAKVELKAGKIGLDAVAIGPGGSYVLIGGSGPAVPNGDFDGDGIVGFTDFISFAMAYSTVKGDPTYSASYDMNQDDKIDFTDFVMFAQVYGKPPAKLAKTVSSPGGNAGAALTIVSEAPVSGLRSYVVRLTDAASVSGFGLTVSFDAAALAYVGAENLAGSAINLAGDVALQVDRSAGTVELADVLPNAVADGDLVRLTFRELTGSGRVEISQAMVSDPTGRVNVLMGARLAAVEAYELHQNSPNPFNPQTQIAYSLPEAAHVRLTIYSVNGQEVAALVDAAQAPGRYLVTWDARDAVGRDVASGVYFYRMEANGVQLNRKMLLLR